MPLIRTEGWPADLDARAALDMQAPTRRTRPPGSGMKRGWAEQRRQQLEEAAAEMRARYAPYRDAHVRAGRISWDRRRERMERQHD